MSTGYVAVSVGGTKRAKESIARAASCIRAGTDPPESCISKGVSAFFRNTTWLAPGSGTADAPETADAGLRGRFPAAVATTASLGAAAPDAPTAGPIVTAVPGASSTLGKHSATARASWALSDGSACSSKASRAMPPPPIASAMTITNPAVPVSFMPISFLISRALQARQGRPDIRTLKLLVSMERRQCRLRHRMRPIRSREPGLGLQNSGAAADQCQRVGTRIGAVPSSGLRRNIRSEPASRPLRRR